MPEGHLFVKMQLYCRQSICAVINSVSIGNCSSSVMNFTPNKVFMNIVKRLVLIVSVGFFCVSILFVPMTVF